MVDEVHCRAKLGGKASEGVAHMETDFLLFRGRVFRLKVPFSQMKSVKAEGQRLHLTIPDGKLTLELGRQAERWARKILHPKSLIRKLGINPVLRTALIGFYEQDFISEVHSLTSNVSIGTLTKNTDLILFGAECLDDLKQLRELKKSLRPSGAIWVVSPKGKQRIKETDVLGAARKAGFVDVKVASFSPTHTSHKIVIPLAER